MPKKQTTTPAAPAASSLVFAVVAGLFFFITILKFGNPVILDRDIMAPDGLESLLYDSWPPRWATLLFVPVMLAGLLAVDFKRVKFHWVLSLPLVWLGWEAISATQTVSPALSRLALAHFTMCASLFYLGVFARKGMSNPWPIWVGMAMALCWSMRLGLEQHFGGLEATRKMIASSPEILSKDPRTLAMMKNPDYIKRLNSNRIFGSFGNPNSLAGGIVLLLPLTLVFLWRLTPKVRMSIRVLFVLILGGCGAGCLYWSGSKAGWLVALVAGLVALGHAALPWKWRRGLISGVLIIGVAGFAYKYADYFKKERNSVGARFTYWRAALTVINHHPWLGTGPGTFQIPFAQIKKPDDEMARLCHNDYLEQASDSGVLGCVSYTGMVLIGLYSLYRYLAKKEHLDWLKFAVWLGVSGLCLHSVVDFHLYVTGLAWTAFFLCGWLAGHDN